MPEKLCGMVLLTIFRELWELKILVDLLQKDMKKITLAILYLNRVLLYYYFCNRVDNCFSIIPSGRFVICCGWLRVYMNVVSFLAGLATYIFSIILVHSDIKATEYFKINCMKISTLSCKFWNISSSAPEIYLNVDNQ